MYAGELPMLRRQSERIVDIMASNLSATPSGIGGRPFSTTCRSLPSLAGAPSVDRAP